MAVEASEGRSDHKLAGCANLDDLWSSQGMTRQRWDEAIQLMIDRHNMNELTSSDKAAMLDYLEKHYPPRAPNGGGQNPFAQ